ncbi:DDRRRQL repeat protein YjdP [Citrobacter sedlakii]|uniref:DDRRRQL repeat protein YjdP n=1 Tax=Citrobacter sedlakii TaxID=67826 RepID=UPI00333A43FD
MKRYSTLFLFSLLSLSTVSAQADVIDDAIGNIQQAINDAYNPGSNRNDDDDDRYDRSRQTDSRQYDDRRRKLEDRRRRLDERQRQLDDDRRRLEEDERRLEEDYERW